MVLTSQSTMTMSSLMPSASMEPINQVDVNNARMMHNRSASEPDFGRSPRQVVIRFSFHLMFCILFADKGVFGFAVLN